jgi:hypothetical protein
VPQVDAIVAQGVAEFEQWLRGAAALITLSHLRP